MAQPHTLDKNMTTSDRLVLSCRRCGLTFSATKRQAQRRYGPRATSYYIEATSRCGRCGGRQIDAAIDKGAMILRRP